jgi:glycosyltransferase involved in cell wall biosynthesis
MDRLTVIVPTCNSERTIKRTLDSILNQTLAPDRYDVIVSDSKSTDRTLDIVASSIGYKNRVSVVEFSHQLSMVEHFNVAARLYADGDLLCIHAHDDISLPDRFARQVDVLENDRTAAVCMSHATAHGSRAITLPNESTQSCRIKTFCSNLWIAPTAMFRTDKINRQRLFDNRFELSEDYRLWSMLILSGAKIIKLDDTLVSYYMGDNNVSVVRAARQNQTAAMVMADHMLTIFPEMRLLDARKLAGIYTNLYAPDDDDLAQIGQRISSTVCNSDLGLSVEEHRQAVLLALHHVSKQRNALVSESLPRPNKLKKI